MTDTHFVRYDAPDRRAHIMRAVCGTLIRARQLSPQPTCPECREWLHRYEHLAVGAEGSPHEPDRRD